MLEKGSVFSYYVTESGNKNSFVTSELSEIREFGKYTIYFDVNTPFSSASNGAIECAIFGVAVNVMSGDSDCVVVDMAEKCKNIRDVIEYERYLGGKYIILFRKGEQYYLQGDATCSIPCFYNTDDAFICSSNDKYIVEAKGYCMDDEYSLIRQSGDIFQAMPYDITSYRQVKQLIPNHYLDINNQAIVRFVNSQTKQKTLSVDKAVKITMPMIENILEFYMRTYKLYCPITSGRDSRVVLSFLMNSNAKFSCYTIKHPEHNDNTPDIVIPIELCKKADIKHSMIEDVTVSDALKNEMDDLLGKDNYSLRTLRIGQTIKEHFGDGAIINGDIIGQVGKCSLHRDIPVVFATSSYFCCKLHNYSKGAKKQLKYWLKEIKNSGERINVFDLFSIENRMGRWAGQINNVYDTIGQISLNIFNSRSIIYTWTAVDRKKRKKSMIHLALIRNTCPSLLNVDFEKDESVLLKLSKSTGLLYLIASYTKFYLEKARFKRTLH